MKKLFKSFIKPFLSKYEVVCTNYHVIPGMPVSQHQQTHAFDRGAALEAREFYVKVVSSEMTKAMAPVEVKLRKIYLGGKTIEQKQFGPVEQLKNVNSKKK
ncbi:hypothetical protein [Pontibacter sp. H249]|uniref:hypothetical protein n=1 Tax=Pontibacter sp. H249 TaxID=3133420 RepID=UPI0030C3A4D2